VVGVAALGLAIPSLALRTEELARLNAVDPERYTVGLGAERMALCAPGEDTTTLALDASSKALEAWGGDEADIGLVAVGTESGDDYARPLTQAVCRRFDLSGSLRSYEVKHACLGGTLAVRQAVEWILSGASAGRSALVVAADVCRYARMDASEPTQGAGAVAMIIGEPTVAGLSAESYHYSLPIDDFNRPIGSDYPVVNGRTSHRSYLNAARSVFGDWAANGASGPGARSPAAYAFHCPFPRMVEKACVAVFQELGQSKGEAEERFGTAVGPHLGWNRQIGNSYTASLWFGVAHALARLDPGQQVAAFSYGSGCGAELLFATRQAGPAPYWAADLDRSLAAVTEISGAEYEALRRHG
jgi:hydroxymethylglutaryl-CoA synthase